MIVILETNVRSSSSFLLLKASKKRKVMATDFVVKFKRYLKEGGKSPKLIENYIGVILTL